MVLVMVPPLVGVTIGFISTAPDFGRVLGGVTGRGFENIEAIGLSEPEVPLITFGFFFSGEEEGDRDRFEGGRR